MFGDYELIEFSEKMRKIRNSLGFSRQIVSKISGINVDTIRKIEKGVCVPRFETLEILSQVYKKDLLQMLNNYKANTSITYFYENINFYLVSNDIKSLLELHTEFCEWNTLINTKTLVNRSELLQIEKFFEALYYKFSEHNCTFEQAIDILIYSLNITIPTFSLKNWNHFYYNALELRILYCIASFLLQNKNYILSANILTYMLDKVDIISQSKMDYNFMIIKLYTLISYNCHMVDKHSEALIAAENGIKLSQQYNLMENLALLLCRKGVAMLNLHLGNYSVYLNQAVVLLDIQNNYELARQYRAINKAYEID